MFINLKMRLGMIPPISGNSNSTTPMALFFPWETRLFKLVAVSSS